MAFDIGHHHLVIMLGQPGDEGVTHIINPDNLRFGHGDFLGAFIGVGVKPPGHIVHQVNDVPEGTFVTQGELYYQGYGLEPFFNH